MTITEKLVILSGFVGSEFVPRYDDLRVSDCGKEYQLIWIYSKDDGEIIVTLRDPDSEQMHDTTLKVYNPNTHRYSYNRELINTILKALGRKRVKAVKETLHYPFK